MRMIGILLILIGVAGLAWGGFSWTREKTVLDAGPIEIKADQRESLPIPPIAGGICLVAGIALVASGSRQRI